MKKTILSVIFLIPLFLYSTLIPGGDVSGVWDLPGSPYYIDGEITVQPGEELIIEAGVDVIFNDHYKFIVMGRLEAVGTANDTIRFMPLDENVGWHSLRFIDGNLSGLQASEINYCQFQQGFALGDNDDKCGGAIFCSNSGNLTISNSYFFQNYAEWDGGGIYLEDNSDVDIDNCLFLQNNCGFYGGGMVVYGSASTIENCTFEGNNSAIFAAGFSSWNGANSELYNCSFLANNAGACAGVYTVNSNLIMANVLFQGNITDYGSGAACGITSSNVEVSNVTAVDNISPLSGGAFWLNDGTLDVYNSILWNNQPEDIYTLSGTSSIANSCVSDGSVGPNVIYDDPQFIDYAGTEYHLNENSPCIDTGDETLISFTLPEFDLDGNDRIVDGDNNGTATIDMGVFEYYELVVTTGFIVGVVSDTEGLLLSNAEITAGIYTTQTNIYGEYEMEVETGEYTVSCYAEGYEIPDEVQVTVLEGETVTVNFVLEPEVGIDNDELEIRNCKLSNYPNPFNPSTIISFELGTDPTENVELLIYNLRGQKVRSFLINSSTDQLINSVTWHGDDEFGKPASSGVYLYKLNVDGKTEAMRKCVLLK